MFIEREQLAFSIDKIMKMPHDDDRMVIYHYSFQPWNTISRNNIIFGAFDEMTCALHMISSKVDVIICKAYTLEVSDHAFEKWVREENWGLDKRKDAERLISKRIASMFSYSIGEGQECVLVRSDNVRLLEENDVMISVSQELPEAVTVGKGILSFGVDMRDYLTIEYKQK